METDVALLNQKIDHLTTLVEAQNQQFEAQRRQQEEFDELKRDVIPVVNHMIKISIDELAEIGTEFQSEDLLFLVKRLLRDTHLLGDLLGRIEGIVELVDETQVISQQVFNQAVIKLDTMERDGYFDFARSGWQIVERIVEEFSEEDVEALGDNVVTILTTVKNLTQPEILSMTNNALSALQDAPVVEGDVSMWSLLRDLSDPQVRRGMARLLNMVKILADQPGGKLEN